MYLFVLIHSSFSVWSFTLESPDVDLCGLSPPDEQYFSKEGSMKIHFSSDAMITWSGFSANFNVIPRQGNNWKHVHSILSIIYIYSTSQTSLYLQNKFLKLQ